MTKQKRAVIEALEALMGQHPTAEQIYMHAKSNYPSIAIGTVYRNLTLMVESGELMRISVQGEPDHFDFNPSDHFHIICDKCGKLYDVPLSTANIKIHGLEDGTVLCPETLTMKCICALCGTDK